MASSSQAVNAVAGRMDNLQKELKERQELLAQRQAEAVELHSEIDHSKKQLLEVQRRGHLAAMELNQASIALSEAKLREHELAGAIKSLKAALEELKAAPISLKDERFLHCHRIVTTASIQARILQRSCMLMADKTAELRKETANKKEAMSRLVKVSLTNTQQDEMIALNEHLVRISTAIHKQRSENVKNEKYVKTREETLAKSKADLVVVNQNLMEEEAELLSSTSY